MLPVLTVAEMAAVDERARATTPLEVLVGRAGTAVAVAAGALLGGTYGRRVTVVAGKGNNGADGRVAAGLLAGRGARTTVVEAESADALGPVDLVIDAGYGTGFRGEYLAPRLAPGTRVLAVDIPSGVRGDTGEACGSPLAAERTVTFAALKPGLLQWDGVRLSGAVQVADIGLDPGDPAVGVVEDDDVAARVPPRRYGGNKWSAAVLVVAGSPGMTGAAALCARAAYRAGAGMVRLGVPRARARLECGRGGGRRRPRCRGLGVGARSRPRRAAARSWSARGSGGRRRRCARCAGWSRSRPSRWSSTPTGSSRWAGWTTDHRPRPAPRWCSPPTTANTGG